MAQVISASRGLTSPKSRCRSCTWQQACAWTWRRAQWCSSRASKARQHSSGSVHRLVTTSSYMPLLDPCSLASGACRSMTVLASKRWSTSSAAALYSTNSKVLPVPSTATSTSTMQQHTHFLRHSPTITRRQHSAHQNRPPIIMTHRHVRLSHTHAVVALVYTTTSSFSTPSSKLPPPPPTPTPALPVQQHQLLQQHM